MRRTRIGLGALLVVAAGLPGVARAGLRASFSLDQAAWDATDVVVAVRAPRTSMLTVLEVWKGELQMGAGITVKDLPGKPENEGEMNGQTGPVVAGDRMVLFLKPVLRDGKAATGEYVGAGMTPAVSVVWVDGDTPYALQQHMNPGPAELTAIAASEEELKGQVDPIWKEQQQLEGYTVTKDTAALAKLCLSANWSARTAAVNGLGQCGEAGLQELRKMAGDSRYDQSRLVTAMTAAAGTRASAEMTALLQKEVIYWKQKAPGLAPDWWNNARPAQERTSLQGHFTLLSGLLWFVGREHDVHASDAISQLCAIFSATPALSDPKGMLQSLQEARIAVGAAPAPIGPVQK